ncbi:hypothetical protein ACKFRM_07315 [Corynebacterium sp. YSMAA1_1_D6]|uniref:hypothetical protein n=1 Tax=Corynebacterium sp. YSMAA1_1_D6 TaxID=3383589 RepID=UPI0038D1DA31
MRLSTSLVTVCATSLALVTPVASAADTTPTPAPATAESAPATAEDAAQDSGQDADQEAGKTDSSEPESSGEGSSTKESSSSSSNGSDGGSSLNVGHPNTSELSPECKAQVDQARKEHEQAVADGTAGSSFMGPEELALGVLNGYGSSGMPAVPDCIDAEKEAKLQKEWDEMPEWVQSARPTETSREIGAWLAGIASLLGVSVNVMALAVQFNPQFRNQLAATLRSMGFYWDNSKKHEEEAAKAGK